ncbi:cytochrome c biogenesis protein CcsA [bacterium]|nr:cytochrome c biogenesis protein CcsA [bacterium]MCB1221501.1 cytochrome c biogenesis protein CcsA [bacterium]UNM09312.1 MAG: cytochrome c biogenesis protein CcsA [Planctomycetales bacterium]
MDEANVQQVSHTLQFYDYAVFGYLAAFTLYAVHVFFARNPRVGQIAAAVLASAWVLQTVFLVKRTLFYFEQHGGFVLPSTNMFEVMNYFVWLSVPFYLWVEWKLIKTRLFGAFALFVPLLMLAFNARSMSMDAGAADPRELFPSLKSYWLWIHVSCMILSYAILALGAIFAFLYVLRALGVLNLERFSPKFSLKDLDRTSYRMVLFGFPILTLGVFLGAVWADSAWGRYWGWDPKEVWALIIWLVYLGYIHFRMMGWVGYRPALINLLGFSAVLMTFWGVNILANVFGLNSIHAYSNGGQEDIYFLAILAVGGLAPIVMLFLPGPKRDLKDIEDEEDEIVPSIRRHVGGGAPGSSDGLHPTPPGRSPQPPAEHKQS